jgi:hypothetical protein
MVTLMIDLYRRHTDTCLTIFIEDIPEEIFEETRVILRDIEMARYPDFELVLACRA